MIFKIFDAVSGGNELWSESHNDVPVERGVFSVMLGLSTSIPDSIFANPDCWLELILEGSSTLSPRTRFTSTGYAYTAIYSDTAEYARSAATDNDWTLSGNRLFPSGNYGLSMRNSNVLYGTYDTTHVCHGTACTTGLQADSHAYCTISGGNSNTALHGSAVAGGFSNHAQGYFSNIGGGYYNKTDSGFSSVIGGGGVNMVRGSYSSILGGYGDTINADYSYLFGIKSKLTTDSTFMVDMPCIRFGSEIDGYVFPDLDGITGQVLMTNGSGHLSWSSPGDTDWVISGSDMYSNILGSVGIGTTTPGHKLEVHGSTHIEGGLTWQAETSYISIPPSAILDDDPSMYMWHANFNSYYDHSTVGDGHAPVFLPHQSTITRMTYYWYDANTTYETYASLRRYCITGGEQSMAHCTSSGSIGEGVTVDSTISNPTIDNSQYVYYLHVRTTSVTALYRYVIVEYFTTKPH